MKKKMEIRNIKRKYEKTSIEKILKIKEKRKQKFELCKDM